MNKTKTDCRTRTQIPIPAFNYKNYNSIGVIEFSTYNYIVFTEVWRPCRTVVRRTTRDYSIGFPNSNTNRRNMCANRTAILPYKIEPMECTRMHLSLWVRMGRMPTISITHISQWLKFRKHTSQSHRLHMVSKFFVENNVPWIYIFFSFFFLENSTSQ